MNARDRAIAKATAVVEAYTDVFGEHITRAELLFALCVAQHETQCGDAWHDRNGNPVHNWGALQWRTPTPDEMLRIKAGDLKVGDTIPGGILQQDSSPTTGKYYVFFRAFLSDRAGAAAFLTTLYKRNPDARSVARSNGESYDFAKAMYRHDYFENTHPTKAESAKGMKPARAPFGPHGALLRVDPLLPAEDLNVHDYSAAIDLIWPTFLGFLHDFELSLPGLDVASVDDIKNAVAASESMLNESIAQEAEQHDTLPAASA